MRGRFSRLDQFLLVAGLLGSTPTLSPLAKPIARNPFLNFFFFSSGQFEIAVLPLDFPRVPSSRSAQFDVLPHQKPSSGTPGLSLSNMDIEGFFVLSSPSGRESIFFFFFFLNF